MFSEGFSFPHPVLGLNDDINGEFNCSIEVDRNAQDRAIRFYNIKYEISNNYISNLVEKGDAGILVKVYCSSTMKTWTLIDPGDSFQINENDLFNKVEIDVLIIAKNQIPRFQDRTFNSQFSNYSFSVNSKEVLAVSGRLTLKIEKIDEKLGLGNIFKFFSHDPNLPVQFTYHQNKIHIMYPVDGNGEHPPNVLFKTSPWTAYTMFIIPALAGAFRFAEQDKADAQNYEWYSVLVNLLSEDQWQQDAFTNAQLLLKKGIPILNSYNELKQ